MTIANPPIHVICGACGSNKELSFRIEPKGNCAKDGTEYPAVFISCANCSNLTGLDEVIPEERKKPKDKVVWRFSKEIEDLLKGIQEKSKRHMDASRERQLLAWRLNELNMEACIDVLKQLPPNDSAAQAFATDYVRNRNGFSTGVYPKGKT